MNKKRFVISLLCSITILFIISSSTALADYSPDPTPEQLHKSSEFTDVMWNLEYLYKEHGIFASNVKSFDSLLSHDLIFNIKGEQTQDSYAVKTELMNKELAEKYRNLQVDLYGTNYYVNCYFSQKGKQDDNNKTCMYGGITNYQGNHFDNDASQNIVVNVFEDKKNSLSFQIQTDKKQVTAQELDIKTRNFLISKLKLYEYNSSPFETGYIKFTEKDGSSFWYDMMPPPGNAFDQAKYLLIYNDNKTVESKSVKIEVYLTKKERSFKHDKIEREVEPSHH
ncbi:exotoxin beta-grasp domain-containing protein [Staphylococcus delphini]|uniref:exotoxin beta-grasp domain-containing protein n=1 Tax=Staphylococcus delphini TaxID=53344 RepID=UPI0021D2682A|nr:exotoxin OB-fold domain-containing protein [Staphylococcus delphini]UXS36446.1 exotoxin [Staphylococcus delphini]UXS43924.1 exotoxin [Staphylococcus delphini]UXV44548.1 exotoxin [Staphylococcus delphini]